MRRFPILATTLTLLIAAPVLAGSEKSCDVPVQDCLNVMVSKLQSTGFIGVEIDESKSSEGIYVSKVIPGTAAESSGIQEGDLLYSLNGIRFNKEGHAEMKKVKVPGKEVTVTIQRDGASKTMKMTLAPMPADLMAKYIGEHMMVHAKQEEKKAKTAKK